MSIRRSCVFPGSFDPATLGHLDLIRRAGQLFDQVFVAVLTHSSKTQLLPMQERVQLIQAALAEQNLTAQVAGFSEKLLVDVCAELGAQVILRGLRPGADADLELPLAMMNRQLAGVETLMLPADPKFAHVSSSLVKQINAYGGEVKEFVPDVVRKALLSRR